MAVRLSYTTGRNLLANLPFPFHLNFPVLFLHRLHLNSMLRFAGGRAGPLKRLISTPKSLPHPFVVMFCLTLIENVA